MTMSKNRFATELRANDERRTDAVKAWAKLDRKRPSCDGDYVVRLTHGAVLPARWFGKDRRFATRWNTDGPLNELSGVKWWAVI